MFEVLDNGQILIIEEIATGNQTVVAKSHFEMLKKVAVDSAKTQLTLGEETIINFRWQKFNGQGLYIDDPNNDDLFQVDIAGISEMIIPTNGVGQVIFSSDEPGEFIIKTVNPGVDNAEIKVVVS